MSRAHHLYPAASTSYHQPPSDIGARPPRTALHRRQHPASSHLDFSQDIYIPESQEELHRVSIESRLLRPSGPTHNPDMRTADLTSASSTFDTYDRIGRDDTPPAARPTVSSSAARYSRASNMPAASHHLAHLDADESLIPGVGRGVRSTVPSQTSYQERLRSLNHHADQHRFQSSPSKSPYRPGKYSSAYANSHIRPLPAPSQSRPSVAPRQPHVESESESEPDSVSDSGESDAINVRTATFNSTGNHRNFAATPAGHTATMTTNLRQRPTLGQDTLDRIEFDIYTDTDADNRPRRDALPTRAPAQQHSRPRPDPTGPFASPRATNTFGMNAADYQQHLASRTLTSPALRTLIGDRSRSPDSPTPAPSIDGVLHAGKHNRREPQRQTSHQQPSAARQTSVSAISAFEDLARRLQRDVEHTRRAGDAAADDMDDGSASNSGGSGFGPGSQASSARTRVEPESAPNAGKVFDAAHFNSNGYPAHQKSANANDAACPWGVRLPDVTGLTSALGSPVKARDTVKHRPFDKAVGNQEARLEELVNLRCFVDGIQVELDRAGERILNLEQAQEQQSHEFQGFRSEMQTALNDVRASQPASNDQLDQLILQKLNVSSMERMQQQPTSEAAETQTQSRAPAQKASEPTARDAASAADAPLQDGRSQVEVVNRLYAELEKLRTAMEEQYKSAAGINGEAGARHAADARAQHAAYIHQDTFPNGRDPWDAIEALRLQVLSLAGEVESLNGLVLEHLVDPPAASRRRQARSSAVRQRLDREEGHYEDAHPASDPIHPVRHAPARPHERVELRTDPIDHESDDYYHRRVSFGRHHNLRRAQEEQDGDEYDRTIDAIAENLRVQRQRQRTRHTSPPVAVTATDELDDNEISQLAEARADRASARIINNSHSRHVHDSRICTVCSSQLRSDKRKASRRTRLLEAEQRRQAIELEESILLEAFDRPASSLPANPTAAASPGRNVTMTMDQDQIAMLRIILQEHWDEFLHQRILYSELADELKSIDPSMSKVKRGILAKHVLEAVELLELKADRINRLESIIQQQQTKKPRKSTQAEQQEEEGEDEEEAEVMVMMEGGRGGGDKVRKQAGSRHPSSSNSAPSTAGGRAGVSQNRLKSALESFERRTRLNTTTTPSLPTTTTAPGGRYSPPTSLQL